MKKIIIMTLIALLNASFVNAKSLVLTLSDGNNVYYQLGGDTEPVIRFTASGMVVEADSYQFSDFSSFYISEDDMPMGVESIETQQPTFQDGKIVVPSGCSDVRLYDSNGRQCQVDMVKSEDNSLLDMSSLSAGVYIVKVGQETFKILCK